MIVTAATEHRSGEDIRRAESRQREFIDDLLGGHGIGGLAERAERCGLQLPGTLWGSRIRSAPLTWMIGVPGWQGTVVGRVVASALPDLPPAAESAVVAQPLLGVQGRGTPGVAA